MNTDDRHHLLTEQKFLRGQLEGMPQSARLTRMSTQARLRSVETQLGDISADERAPARARLTFSGAPVIGSRGIFADFGTRAVSSFTDAVASVAASLAAPLAAMGPIPNREQNQLLITSTAIGSFGFELEELRGQQLAIADESPVAIALERTRALLQSTLGNDEDLADVASETDPRALDKIRVFLTVLADSNAVCAVQHAGRSVRFTDVGQVRNSLERLGADNLREATENLHGEFVGALPKGRAFEFKLSGDDRIIRGKVSPLIQNVDEINLHLHQSVQIDVISTQVGNGQPRFLLTRLPAWSIT